MDQQFDSIVIGAGQSGPSLAARLAQAGRKTAIVERSHLGGTCVNTGCVPSKTMIASARVAYLARRAAEFGVHVGGPVTVDMRQVKARKDKLIEESREHLGQWLGDVANLKLIQGEARFTGAHEIAVDSDKLSAPEIFINVGARAAVADLAGVDGIDYMTSTSLLDLEALPAHLLIVGGSYIALEMAQMMRRFGSKVTLLADHPRVIAHEDPAVSDAVQAVLENEGVQIQTSAQVVQLGQRESEITVMYRQGSTLHQVDGSHLLLASGRAPNTDNLGLDRIGVKTNARGYIVVDDELRTTVPGIWALGEVNGRGAFTHTSFNDYEIVAANLLENAHRGVSQRINAYALYIDPPLAHIGMNREQARATGRPVLHAALPMVRVSRARERSETEGFMSVLVDAQSQKILGATILGIEADEVIHCLLDLMYADAPVQAVQHAMHIHPTVSEYLPTLLQKLEPLT